MKVDPQIFKAYDIRGTYPDQINEEIAYRIGRAYARLLGEENPGRELKMVMARDMRVSSPALRENLVRGLVDEGVRVTDIGLTTTPTFYFAVAYNGYDGGVQISASHNPAKYNGFKLVRAGSVPVSGETGMQKVRDLAVANDFGEPKSGEVEIRQDITAEAVRILRENTGWEKIKPFKIAVDTANGMGAVDIEEIFRDLPCTLVKLNFDLNGNFPVHEPDPLKEENMKLLHQEVIKNQADLGIATDGDSDRWFFVDETGRTMPPQILRGIMAQIALKENPGATVCYDIRPGRITRDMIEEAGGRAVVTRVGHSLIKETMIRENAVFGGESSGHFFYKLPFGVFEAPVILVLKFLVYLSESGQKLSEIINRYDRYFHSGEINSTVSDPQKKIAAVEEKFADGNISKLDGITVEYPEYWFNVRASNTEPLLRFALEATSRELMEQKRDEILAFIRS